MLSNLSARIVTLLLLFACNSNAPGFISPVAPCHAPSPGASGLAINDLKCEGQTSPLAIDSLPPRLSWILRSDQRGQRQTAYQVLVATSAQRLAQDNGDLWNTGKVTSSDTINVAYKGRPLASGQPCHWKVRVWDREDSQSAWSEPATWEMALLHPGDWSAQWLNDARPNPSTDAEFYLHDPAPLFRHEFSVAKPLRRARLHITGLGYYEASLNGQRIGDHVLDPGWTAYAQRVLYSTYDVTSELRIGANCIGVMLGNGWYNPLPLRMWGHLNLRDHLAVGRPRFIAQLNLEYENGDTQSLVSDPTWKTAQGPIRFNSIYLGEVYDASRELPGWDTAGFDDSNWSASSIALEPVGRLEAQSQPPIRVKEQIPTVRITEPQPGVFIHDLGQNFSGCVTLRLAPPLPPAGSTIVLRYGELLSADGSLNPMTAVCGQIKGTTATAAGGQESVGGPGAPPIAWQSDTYITRGTPGHAGNRAKPDDAETYTSRFTFHGFRYVEVQGLPATNAAGDPLGPVTITGLRLNSDVADAGSFACSSELLNQIQLMCRRTFLANLFSVQSDCPHRERFAYGGDIVATSDAFMLNFDMSQFYAKTVRDFSDTARPDGLLTDTAPFVGIQYCGVGWAMAHPLLLTQLLQHYGDDRIVAEHYDTARRWLLRVAEIHPGGIITQGLSDHEGLEASPEPLMVTPLYVQSARLLATLARALGRVDDALQFESLARASTAAYQQTFSPMFEPDAVTEFSQASLAFALYSGLVPENKRAETLQALIDNIQVKRRGSLSTGIMGTKFMLDVLSRSGRADVACELVTRRTFPSWGWMLENGATTLWEHWALNTNTFSHSHPMFGSVSQWFFSSLGGIQPAPDALGFDSIIISPQPVPNLDWVRTSHRTVRGTIVSNWRRDGPQLVLDIEIPVGATALVYLPAHRPEQITESGIRLASTNSLTLPAEFVQLEPAALPIQVLPAEITASDSRTVVCRIASGRYCFRIDPHNR